MPLCKNQSNHQTSCFKNIKKELTKSAVFFAAGSITTLVIMANQRRIKKVKAKYQEKVDDLKESQKH